MNIDEFFKEALEADRDTLAARLRQVNASLYTEAADEIERLREENDMILGALIEMCDQYLSRDHKLAHDFMSAGESSLKILEHLGHVTTTDNVYYQWKEQENG